MTAKTSAAKKPSPRKTPAPFLVIDRANLTGWLLSCFVIFGCMFFLGVMVGRNTAPVQFDVEEIEKKLAKLQGISVLNEEETGALSNNAPDIQADIRAMEKNIHEMSKLPIVQEDIIDILKDKGKDPEIYEQYVPPVLTPKYAKTAPPKKTPASEKTAPATATAAASTGPSKPVEVLKPEVEINYAKPSAPAVAPPATPPATSTATLATSPEPSRHETAVSSMAFAIQVASLKDPAKARSLMTKFKEKGYPAFCQSSEINSITWHRVRIGPYPNRSMADKDHLRLKAAGVDSLIISMD